MKKIYFLVPFLLGAMVYCQVYDTGTGLKVTSISNTGTAVGVAWEDSHFMWTKGKGMSIIGTLTTGDPLTYTTRISSEGKFISGTMSNPETGLDEMGLYDVEKNTWKYLGGLAGSKESTKSTAWNISSDGTAVVELGYSEDNNPQAIMWTKENGIIDLGTSVSGRTSRANAVNTDKTIIVGRQDLENGNMSGVYWKNGVQHSVIVNGVNIPDFSDVSSDGKTMISNGYPNPIIYKIDEGATEIEIPNDVGAFPRGVASAISADGNKVVGYYYSMFTGPYTGSGFIWTKEKGIVKLNEYVENLGLDHHGISFIIPLSISPDGRYIGGIGLSSDNKLIGFVIELPNEDLNVKDILTENQMSIFPNPVNDILNINSSSKIQVVEIYSISGQKIRSLEGSNKIDVSYLPKGTYIVKIKTSDTEKTLKFIKK